MIHRRQRPAGQERLAAILGVLFAGAAFVVLPLLVAAKHWGWLP